MTRFLRKWVGQKGFHHSVWHPYPTTTYLLKGPLLHLSTQVVQVVVPTIVIPVVDFQPFSQPFSILVLYGPVTCACPWNSCL